MLATYAYETIFFSSDKKSAIEVSKIFDNLSLFSRFISSKSKGEITGFITLKRNSIELHRGECIDFNARSS